MASMDLITFSTNYVSNPPAEAEFSWLKALVPVIGNIVGTLAAAFISYKAIMIGLTKHDERERKNHEETTKREFESRQAAIRREIFFKAAGAVSRSMDYLGKLPSRFISDAELEKMMAGFNASTVMLEMVASLETLAAFNEFRIKFFNVNKALAPKRSLMMKAKSKAETNLHKVQFIDDLSKNFTANLKEINDAQAERFAKFRTENLEESIKAETMARDLSLELYGDLEDHHTKLAECQDDFSLCARRELGFKIDADAYRKMSAEVIEAHKSGVAEVLEEVRRQKADWEKPAETTKKS
jgi:hypothetical protein